MKDTPIAWADSTCNFWVGCTKVSAGCKHCYMFAALKRYGKDPETVRRTSAKTFTAPLHWHAPGRIFTCSMSDFFHEDADDWRTDAWDVIRRTPQHTWIMLTKRPERIAAWLPPDWGDGWPHVWLGVSIENRREQAQRLPILQQIPATQRVLSLEPLLEPLDPLDLTGIAWVIVGGESSPDHRPMEHAWVWPIRDACQRADVAFFFKQSAAPKPEQGTALLHEDGTLWEHRAWPDDRRAPVWRPDLLIHALSYAARGWPVFPCHTPTLDGGCSCRKDCGKNLGKHPRTLHGLTDATTDEATIRRWWQQFPDANIGIVTGAVSGLVVLDEDSYKGGDVSRRELEDSYSPLPETV